MGKEIDLMVNYPRSKRNVQDRGSKKTKDDQILAENLIKNFLMVIGHTDMEDFIIIQNFGSRLFLLLEIIMILIIAQKSWTLGVPKGLCFMICAK